MKGNWKIWLKKASGAGAIECFSLIVSSEHHLKGAFRCPKPFHEINQVSIHCWVDNKDFPAFGHSEAKTRDLLCIAVERSNARFDHGASLTMQGFFKQLRYLILQQYNNSAMQFHGSFEIIVQQAKTQI